MNRLSTSIFWLADGNYQCYVYTDDAKEVRNMRINANDAILKFPHLPRNRAIKEYAKWKFMQMKIHE